MRADASDRAFFTRERVGAVRFAEFYARRPSSMVMVVALASGCAALWISPPAPTPRAERAAVNSPVSDEWTPAALPPLIEIPRLNAATSAPRFGVAVNSATGARRDAYALGDLGADGTAARLEAWIGPTRERETLFVELAEQASRFAATISKFALVKEMRTSRGNVEYAQMLLSDAAGVRSCVGFRLARTDAAGLRGILCPAKSDRAAETRLACLVEGVAPTPNGRERGWEAALPGEPPRRTNGAC